MDIAIAALVGVFGMLIIMSNAVIVYRRIRYKSNESWVPIFGGLFLFIAFCLVPGQVPVYIKVLPFIIDWGCVPGMIHTFIFWKVIYPKWKREGKIK
ncbi:MAG: hypothetical protein KKF93_00225 [Candidatus Omnitrophica bacterium]|nr:hypothetical protein [Candidatus Omnitrophota bacterium]